MYEILLEALVCRDMDTNQSKVVLINLPQYTADNWCLNHCDNSRIHSMSCQADVSTTVELVKPPLLITFQIEFVSITLEVALACYVF